MEYVQEIQVHFVDPSSSSSGTFNDFCTAASDNISSIHKNAILVYDDVQIIELTPMRPVQFSKQT